MQLARKITFRLTLFQTMSVCLSVCVCSCSACLQLRQTICSFNTCTSKATKILPFSIAKQQHLFTWPNWSKVEFFMLAFASNGCILPYVAVFTSSEAANEILFNLPRLTLWYAHYASVFPHLIAWWFMVLTVFWRLCVCRLQRRLIYLSILGCFQTNNNRFLAV